MYWRSFPLAVILLALISSASLQAKPVSHPAHLPVHSTPTAKSSPLPVTAAPDVATELANKLGRRMTPAEIIQASAPAVVAIVSEIPGEGRARGTGFFANAQGLVVTSNHLVAGASEVHLKTHRGTQYDHVKVLMSRRDVDLAVLQVTDLSEAEPFLQLGNSDHVTIGERVVAIGHPMGLEYTVSDGLVSALRDTDVDGLTLIQFSAAASPGSSGGPIINESGQVIGIISMSHPEGQSLNFAVPINMARTALASLRSGGHAAVAEGTPPDKAGGQLAMATATSHSQSPPVSIPAGVDLVPTTPVIKVTAPLPRQMFRQGNRGFEVACPPNWQCHSSKEPNEVVVHLTSPDGLIRFDLATVAVPHPTTLAQFASEIMRSIRALMASSAPGELAPLRAPGPPHMVREANTRVSGLDWKLYVYSHADGDGEDLYSVIMIALQNGQGYVVRYTVPVRLWARARDSVREIVDGVTIF